MEELETTLALLSDSVSKAGDPVEIAGQMPVAQLQELALAALESLAAVRSRVSRTTINIGVSGAVRNGKSTLLQALSGLTDEQFDDALIRGGESESEFLRLADGYRDELWPDESHGTGAANARVQRLRHAVARLVSALVVVSDNRDAMLGALTSGQFNAEAIKGTQDPRRYELVLRAGGRKNCLDIGFNILDYPGSWLSPAFRARNPEAQVDWDECVAHIEDSVMLLLPIDASVVMEAHTQPQKLAVPSILEISTVTDMVSFWLKRRMEVPDEPAVLVLAPLKCEKYFSDNGGRGTNSGLP